MVCFTQGEEKRNDEGNARGRNANAFAYKGEGSTTSNTCSVSLDASPAAKRGAEDRGRHESEGKALHHNQFDMG